jgi:hypothetical protein
MSIFILKGEGENEKRLFENGLPKVLQKERELIQLRAKLLQNPDLFPPFDVTDLKIALFQDDPEGFLYWIKNQAGEFRERYPEYSSVPFKMILQAFLLAPENPQEYLERRSKQEVYIVE